MKSSQKICFLLLAVLSFSACSAASNSVSDSSETKKEETPAAETAAPGVTVSEEGEGDAPYKVTFVYEDKDDSRTATAVKVQGNLQWYAFDDPVVEKFAETGDAKGAKVYNAASYSKDLFNTGYGLNDDMQSYTLEDKGNERFEGSVNLPGNLYYYEYVVTYDDGSEETIQDPANPSPRNEANGHDAGHSLVYVGDAEHTAKGQEYIYEGNGEKGTTEFVSYKAADGTEQPLQVYLPAGYDASREYRTLYVSHGGGGNEAEWMSIGAADNIMDNLIAAGESEPMVMVTMDNTYWEWDFAKIIENFEKNIIPYVEEHYAVSKEADDRALCGLSMGSMTTTTIMQERPDLFGAFGGFSGANVPAEMKDAEKLQTRTIYLGAGNVDMALRNDSFGTEEDRTTEGMLEKLDKNGVKYTFETKPGAHDWAYWRDALTTFVKDHLNK